MDLQFPIGKFSFTAPLTKEEREEATNQIAQAPASLRKAVENLTQEQLNTPYRPGGWTVRQVVHHLPDSHLNSYIRIKLALTEEHPTVKTYLEDRWAELEDYKITPVETSLLLFESLHQRWVLLLRSLQDSDFEKAFSHPELGLVSIDKSVSLYAWHGRHHIAQITGLREKMNW